MKASFKTKCSVRGLLTNNCRRICVCLVCEVRKAADSMRGKRARGVPSRPAWPHRREVFRAPPSCAAAPAPSCLLPLAFLLSCCDSSVGSKPCQALSRYTEQADGSFLISPRLDGKSELPALNLESCQGGRPWGGRLCQGKGNPSPQTHLPVGSSPDPQQKVWPMGSFPLGKNDGDMKFSGKTCCRWMSLILAENSSPSLELSFLNHSSFVKQISSCVFMSKNHI